MTNLVERPRMGRGKQRREQLVEAGMSLLIEGGWSAITTRAAAERAGANLGLIHYHYGGLQQLRLAIARRAGEVIAEAVLADLAEAVDERAALRGFAQLLTTVGTDASATPLYRVAIELLTEAFRDEEIGRLMRAQLREAQEQLAVRIATLRPQWSAERRAGAAVLVTALIDGLVLHRLVDHELPTAPIIAALADLLGIETPTPPGTPGSNEVAGEARGLESPESGSDAPSTGKETSP